jgi:hypothetical protein
MKKNLRPEEVAIDLRLKFTTRQRQREQHSGENQQGRE